jgi:Transposase IS4
MVTYPTNHGVCVLSLVTFGAMEPIISRLVFPARAFQVIYLATQNNIHANQRNNKKTSWQELLKFFGIIILMTKYDFDDRRDLWSKNAGSKYEYAPQFGTLTGMVRDRFDFLFQMIRFSFQPAERPDGMTSKKYRWMLLDNLCTSSMSIIVIISLRLIAFALTKVSVGGTAMEVLGLTLDYHVILVLIGNQRIDARSRRHVMAKWVSCCS